MLYHPILSGTDIIRNTVEPNQSGFAIVYGIASLRVAVSGLSHAAGVDN